MMYFNLTDYRHRVYSDTMLDSIGPIAMITHQLDPTLSSQINYHLVKRRKEYVEAEPDLINSAGFARDDYRINVNMDRYDSGEGKVTVEQSVRGHDVFLFTDVLNYGRKYQRYGSSVTMSPDEHYQDLVRLVLTTRPTAARVNVIMPYLYEGRRYKRNGRESLDCAQMLQELFGLGIDNFITFDAHDGRIANAVPRNNFETFPTSAQILATLFDAFPDINLHPDHFIIVSPDEDSISRCIFYASTLQVPLGIFYSDRNFRRVNGQIIEESTRKYLGDDVTGMDVLLVDDLMDTGLTFLECASYLKAHGAKRVFCAASFVQFTKGIDHMRQAYTSGIINGVFATDMAYRAPQIIASPWYYDVPMAEDLASLVDALNHDASLSALLAPADRIDKLARKHQERYQQLYAKKQQLSYDPRQLSFDI
jgi:ribose-phosphate pyrophosphokinase